MLKIAFAGAVVALIVLCAATPTVASNYPEKPVRIVVPYAPGGASDILARALTQELSKILGQQFIAENKAGAGGRLGAEPVNNTPAQFSAWLDNESVKWTRVVKDSGAKPD